LTVCLRRYQIRKTCIPLFDPQDWLACDSREKPGGCLEAAFKLAYDDSNFDDTWNLYFSKDKFNSLYLLSDVVLIHAIFKSIGESDFAAGQRKIMEEVTAAANGIVDFVHAFTAALWKRHIASHMDATVCAKIPNAPKISEVQLPFFVELADSNRQHA